MSATVQGKTLNSRELNSLIHPLRYLDNRTNLIYLGLDYLTLIGTLAAKLRQKL